MNVKFKILKEINMHGYESQRKLAQRCQVSLGSINQHLKQMVDEKILSEDYKILETAIEEYEFHKPKRAIILAAGTGVRMLPIYNEVPKALLEVNEKPLIETTIEYLHEIGIKEIYVVVGYLKEMFDYLVDLYGVKLIYNKHYLEFNNYYSLKLASKHLEDSYIIPGDLYFFNNLFNQVELNSWYMVGEEKTRDSDFKLLKNDILVKKKKEELGNRNIGVAYIAKSDAGWLRDNLEALSQSSQNDKVFWEGALIENQQLKILARTATKDDVYEINTYQELRDLDEKSTHLNANAIQVAAQALNISPPDIENVSLLKKGMTNRSFLFEAKGEKYIMRVPGEGTDRLINRREEAKVYNEISPHKISDEIIYIDPESGYKIAKFWDGVRNADPTNPQDVKRCMVALKKFHDLKLTVDHDFDPFERLEYYESLWTLDTLFKDYNKTKSQIMGLKKYIDQSEKEYSLCHIDSVPDNFLFKGDEIKLIDWEYAAMQDPHVDIAMFGIYSLYEKEDMDRLIDAYFDGNCPEKTRVKIYAYVAICGLVWSNWCEFKRMHGVEFGEYSLKQYRYAKDYYKYVKEYLDEKGEL